MPSMLLMQIPAGTVRRTVSLLSADGVTLTAARGEQFG